MRKVFSRSLAMFLAFVMVFGAVPVGVLTGLELKIPEWLKSPFGVEAEAADYAVGDIIEFGSYPQSEVKDTATLDALNAATLTWQSYGYYSGDGGYGSMAPSDYMQFAETTLSGVKYRAVRFSSYRPASTHFPLSSGGTHQNYNGYYTNTVYWFKYETLRWRVLDPNDGLVMCETIIDSQAYSNTLYSGGDEYYNNAARTVYANDYATSSIREWLNDDFYNTAFTAAQKRRISLSAGLDDSAYPGYPQYNSAPTDDAVFLLSYNEVCNSAYGFNSSASAYDTARRAQGSDYAKCQGLWVYDFTGSYYHMNSFWRLRFPGHNSGSAGKVGYNGGANYSWYVDHTEDGVRPALRLNLESDNIYNLGEETYSFGNFGDADSEGGHCFGMSATSSAYYIGALDVAPTGASQSKDVNTLALTAAVKKPICRYQAIQGSYALHATVAGGSSYKTGESNIVSDWADVVDYVKNHKYDDKGSLQIGFRRNSEGGHAINFLRYSEVNGQQRIYAYDNNFPDTETYFYKDASDNVHQAPYSTFSGAIDCIALRDVSAYFSIADSYDTTHVIYAEKGVISISGAETYSVDGGIDMGERVVFEISANVNQITIVPLTDNADFMYLNKGYAFGEIDNDTVGTFKLSTDESSIPQDSDLTIINAPVAKTVQSVRVTAMPNKISYAYKIGNFDKTGLTIEATYTNGETETITDTSKINVTGFDPNKTGTQQLTVEYGGKQAEEKIAVTVKYEWWQWLIRLLLLGWLWY